MKRGKIPGAIQKGHKAMLRPLAIRGAGSTPPGELQSKNSESVHQNSLQLGVMYPGEEESQNNFRMPGSRIHTVLPKTDSIAFQPLPLPSTRENRAATLKVT